MRILKNQLKEDPLMKKYIVKLTSEQREELSVKGWLIAFDQEQVIAT